jgi:glycyl-tRNA synthetase
MVEINRELFEKIVKISQSRGFVFNSSSIYGGLRSSYDYGPLGSILKKNIAEEWWKSLRINSDVNIFPIDTSIIQSTQVWKASGHLSEFSDPLVECKKCNTRLRSDKLNEISCECDEPEFTDPKNFNLMFSTNIGPTENEDSKVYLRPETAQGIFINFENVQRTMRAKLPFGIANIGKSFRNEITPGQFIFRTREFEQMEIEFFCKPHDSSKWFEFWKEARMEWYLNLGISNEYLRFREHSISELAHYAKKTVDIEFLYPWGWGELEGIADRGMYDIEAHQNASGKDLSYFDTEENFKILPNVIEPAAGLTRTVFALLCATYKEDNVNNETRNFFSFSFNIAPVQIGILPLSKKENLINLANEINDMLLVKYRTEIDITQSIGKRYRRQDEIGTPYCVTIDFDSLEDGMVTIRDRDTMQQQRVPIDKLINFFEKY